MNYLPALKSMILPISTTGAWLTHQSFPALSAPDSQAFRLRDLKLHHQLPSSVAIQLGTSFLNQKADFQLAESRSWEF
jgi:hypothetical protein